MPLQSAPDARAGSSVKKPASAARTSQRVSAAKAARSISDSNAVARSYKETVQPFVRKYCIECHGKETQSGGVNFEEDFHLSVTHHKMWEKARNALEKGIMPPADHQTRPSEPESAAVRSWIKTSVLEVDCGRTQEPASVTVRRLNRAEYNNTIRDLLGVDLHPADDFPSDDVGNGFDNQGEVLSISPLLMEKYLAAAERVSGVALFGIDLKNPPVNRYPAFVLKTRGSAHAGRSRSFRPQVVIPASGSVLLEANCPTTGEYIFRIVASAQQGGAESAQLDMQVDGESKRIASVRGERQESRSEVRIRLGKGPHRFTAVFVNPLRDPPAPALPEPVLKGKKRLASGPFLESAREVFVYRFELEGPYEVDPHDLALDSVATRNRILVALPGADGTESECAIRVLTQFATRAFRRPVTEREIKPYIDLVMESARDNPFDRAIQTGLTALLISPQFLFRIEPPGKPEEGAGPVPLGAFQVASRLSYFLWSSMPDEELFRLAADGSLLKPAVLKSQVRRMLHDPKSRALVTSFANQWLNLPTLDIARPDTSVFKSFNERLRHDMREETERFFDSIVLEDRSILDLLNGKYTFLNERLAKLYKIPGIEGEKFRRVALDGFPRAGIITQGSILTLTSQRGRTSPVKRGKWILEVLLGSAPPPPPPNVPDLAETQQSNPKASLREQLQIHRKNALCASCHKVMDPLGLGLENFDGIGRFRTKERGGRPIDASGTLPGGESFNGPEELIAVLSRRQQEFCKHFAEALLAYALGRGIEYHDRCAIDEIVRRSHAEGDRFSALVWEIVCSDPFLKRRGGGSPHDR